MPSFIKTLFKRLDQEIQLNVYQIKRNEFFVAFAKPKYYYLVLRGFNQELDVK